jgi:hypothetical protein
MTQGARRALNMKAQYSSGTSVDFQRTIRHCTPEAGTLHNYRCKNLIPHFLLLFRSAYSSTLKMEAACSSEPSVNFYQAKRNHVPEDSLLFTKQQVDWQYSTQIPKEQEASVMLHITLSMYMAIVRRISFTTRSQNPK